MKCAIEIRARERDQVTRKRLNQRKRAKRERDLKRDTAFKDALAQATAKLAQQTTKRMKRMEKGANMKRIMRKHMNMRMRKKDCDVYCCAALCLGAP